MPHESESHALPAWIRDLIHNKIRRQVRLGGLPAHERSDWEQDLALHVVRRLPAFDPQRGTSIRGFIFRVVNRKLASLRRDRQAAKRQPSRACSLDDPRADGDRTSLAGQILGRWQDNRLRRQFRGEDETAQLRMDVANVLSTLPPVLRALAEALKHKTMSQIAREWGISRSSLYTLVAHLKRRFVQAGLADYLESRPTVR